MSDIQQLIQDSADEIVGSSPEIGLQIAVYRNGRPVADVTAGSAHPGTGRAVASDTLFYTTSVGKGVTATVVHVLAERGVFDYDAPISRFWPEFGAHGKEKATIRHALTHMVGVPAVPADTTPEDLCDWDKMCARIADTEPWWEPGTQSEYHAQTYGYIIGETVRRATGKPISQVLAEEIAGPLGVADELFFGVPRSHLDRVAKLEEARGNVEMRASLPDDFPMFKIVPRAVLPSAEFGNRADVLTSDIPAGATGSARALARMYAAIIGEVDGVRLISERRLSEITESAPGLGGWALGYNAGLHGVRMEESVLGGMGSGGTAAYAELGTGTTVAVNKNLVSAGEFSTASRISEIVAAAA